MEFHRLMSLPITASSNNMAESWPLLPLSLRRLRRAELAGPRCRDYINTGQHAARALVALWSPAEEEEETGEGRGEAQASWMAMEGPV